MDNPKIRIESDGKTAVVYLDEEKVKCTSLDFHGEVKDFDIHIKWSGKTQKEDENGHLIIENNEVATEEFHYDSNEAVVD